MKPSKVLSLATGLIMLMLPASSVQGQVSFPGTELLGRPTSNSVTVNVVAGAAIDAYFQYRTELENYTSQTSTVSAAANEPLVAVISGLQSNTRYYYRMVYRQTGTSSWITRDEHSFYTQRPPGSTFTFTVIGDSHINIVFGNPNVYRTTLQNVANDHPDLHVDLGDTFAMDNVTTQAQANNAYLSARSYFGLISHSSPIFLALGNHEEEEAWHLDDTGNIATSKPVMGANARKRYYLNPNPFLDTFYTGNTDNHWVINGDHLPEDYYAWEWGDALFVAIDPYWYTTTKPFIGNAGGGESSDVGSGDRWDWTLGWSQYQWLQQTLQNSKATYKFIFAHHGTGGTTDYIRGGANAVPYVEWGGYNEDGTTWGFDTRRPGWPLPVHQLLVQNHVTAFFHAHDHEFAYEKRDGIVYQLVPMPSDANYSYGSFQLYHETDPYTLRVLPNSGHLRVTVSPSNVTVDYVRAFLPGAGTNAQVAYTYSIGGTTPDKTPPTISSVSASPDSSGTAAIAWTTDEASDSRVDYGLSTALGSNVSSAALATAHSMTLTGLGPGTIYYYQVTSRDAAGNASTSPAGAPASFTTPAVTNMSPSVATPASATPNPVLSKTTSVSVLGGDDGGEANLAYTWATTGTPPAPVTFSVNGTNAAKNAVATFTKAGSYSFQVTIRDQGNLSVTSSVSVTVSQTLTSISVTPASASVITGATQPFTATALDQFGVALAVQPAFTWTVSGGGAISAAGLFTAGSTVGGPFTVRAASGAVNGTASVTVTAVSGGVTYLQGASTTNDSGDSSVARAFATPNASGNLIVAAVSWGNNATVTCSDAQGNSYAVATTQYDSTNNQSLAICYAANAKAGANTVTATFSGAASFRRLLIHEYAGIALVSPVDVVAKNVANGTTTANAITSTAALTTVSGDLIFGAVMDDDGVNSITAGTGFTQRQSVNNKDLASEDMVQSTAGSVAATDTFSAAHRYLAQMVAFKHR